MKTDSSEMRFGTIAVQKKFVTPKQVIQALEIQTTENLSDGKHRFIGRILSDEGLITDAQIYEVLGTLHKNGMGFAKK